MEQNNDLIQGVQPEVQHRPVNLFTEFADRLSQKWQTLPPEKRVYFTQLGLIAAVQAADILTTAVAFQTVPGAAELNPIAGFFLDKGGMVALGLAKMGVAAGQITAMEIVRNRMMRRETTPTINNMMRFWNSVLTVASVNNAARLLIK